MPLRPDSKRRIPTAEEREAAQFVSCPVCDAVPGETCVPANDSSGEWERLRRKWGGVHSGRVYWLREERAREAAEA